MTSEAGSGQAKRRTTVAGVSDGLQGRDGGEPSLPEQAPKPERTLNPAHAILGGAILSAAVTLIGVALNIRSSERLSSEREKRDAAVAEANNLQDKVGELERKLDEAVAKIPASEPAVTADSTTPATTIVPPPPQSIVVVVTIPTPGSGVSPVTQNAADTTDPASSPTTRAAPSTTVRATPTTEAGTSTTTTTGVSTTTSSTTSTTTTLAP